MLRRHLPFALAGSLHATDTHITEAIEEYNLASEHAARFEATTLLEQKVLTLWNSHFTLADCDILYLTAEGTKRETAKLAPGQHFYRQTDNISQRINDILLFSQAPIYAKLTGNANGAPAAAIPRNGIENAAQSPSTNANVFSADYKHATNPSRTVIVPVSYSRLENYLMIRNLGDDTLRYTFTMTRADGSLVAATGKNVSNVVHKGIDAARHLPSLARNEQGTLTVQIESNAADIRMSWRDNFWNLPRTAPPLFEENLGFETAVIDAVQKQDGRWEHATKMLLTYAPHKAQNYLHNPRSNVTAYAMITSNKNVFFGKYVLTNIIGKTTTLRISDLQPYLVETIAGNETAIDYRNARASLRFTVDGKHPIGQLGLTLLETTHPAHAPSNIASLSSAYPAQVFK